MRDGADGVRDRGGRVQKEAYRTLAPDDDRAVNPELAPHCVELLEVFGNLGTEVPGDGLGDEVLDL